MRIALLTPFDANDPNAWSGIPWHIARALRSVVDLEVLEPLCWENLQRQIRVQARLTRRVTGQSFDVQHCPQIALAAAAHFALQLARTRPCDAILGVSARSEIAYLPTRLPIYTVADATLAGLYGYYPYFSCVADYSMRAGLALERRHIRRSTFCAASDWAAQSAIRDFGADPRRVHVLPFGANVDGFPPEPEPRPATPLRLLFLGVDWERKGGPIAWRTFELLLARGIDVRLTICGCVPPDAFRHPRAEIIARLDKGVAAERARFEQLLRESHFLLLPTRAECFGLVFCEASAFGVPSIATATGGVPSAVEDGINGRLLPLSADAEAYAEVILDLLADPAAYAGLRERSRERFARVLNWDAWGRALIAVIQAAGPKRLSLKGS